MKKISIIIFIIIIIIISIFWWIFSSIKKPISSSKEQINIEIIEGQKTEEIAKKLKEKKIIKSSFIFEIYTFLKQKNILPGNYDLAFDMNYDQILEILSQGKAKENTITIIEGLRREEIADYLEKKQNISKEEFLEKTKNLEGYLFPDTYKIAIDATVDDIIKKLTDNFKIKTKQLSLGYKELILASIVEKEAKNDNERAKIAGVYKNRLELDMKLDADPTVQYAKGNWDLLTIDDYYNIISPYNTYLNKGLPPGPICNPGLASIKAALYPDEHEYYYFFHLKDGSSIFSKTYEEHNQNIQKHNSQI